MTNVLLVSEDFVKTNSGLNSNVWGSYLLPAIREAQDIRLQQVLGTGLYMAVLDMVAGGTIADPGNEAYRILLDEYIQIYLMYQTISDLVPIIGVKLTNLGTVVSNDEHVTNLTDAEREKVQKHYELRADFYCRRMQVYLLNNRSYFPELEDGRCADMAAELRSAASTGLWLGGDRGYRYI